MTDSLNQWSAMIATFNCGSLFTINSHSINLTGRLYIFSFLLCDGEIEPNPGL